MTSEMASLEKETRRVICVSYMHCKKLPAILTIKEPVANTLQSMNTAVYYIRSHYNDTLVNLVLYLRWPISGSKFKPIMHVIELTVATTICVYKTVVQCRMLYLSYSFLELYASYICLCFFRQTCFVCIFQCVHSRVLVYSIRNSFLRDFLNPVFPTYGIR